MLGRHALAIVAALVLACDQTPSPSATTGPAPGSAAPDASANADATAGPDGSQVPGVGDDQPTAGDLIEADVAAGKLDAPTGLLYRVYAKFGDPRLPAEYAAAPPSEDRAAIETAMSTLESLPEAIATELRPFLVRPTHPESVFNPMLTESGVADGVELAAYRPGPLPVRITAAVGPVVCNSARRWGYVLGQGLFKVWGRCGNAADDADIQLVTTMVEILWQDEADYLDELPIEDEGKPVPDEWQDDQGGDSRIDIYLIDPCVTRGGRCRSTTAAASAPSSPPDVPVEGVNATSGFILVPRSSLAKPFEMESTLAHELFHIFENAFNHDGLYDEVFRDYHWIVEASATWAEWRFVPAMAPEEVAPRFRTHQRSWLGLQSTFHTNEYASFAWPLFMEERAGDGTVAKMWEALKGEPNFERATGEIDATLSFHDEYRIFALRAWNEDLGVGDPVDPLLPEPPTGDERMQPSDDRRHDDIELEGEETGTAPTEVTEFLQSLDSRYSYFTVADDVGKIELDLSGLGPVDSYYGDVLVNVEDQGWERRKLKKAKTTWCMDNPDDAIEEFVVVISNHDTDPSTPVGGSWTVASPAEPCLSYEVKITYTDFYNYGKIPDTFTFEGYVDKIEPDLAGSGAVTISGTGTIEGERPGWASCNPGIDYIPNGSGSAILMASIADDDPASRKGDTASFSAFPDLSTADFGVSTQPFTMERQGGILDISSITPENPSGNVGGDLCPHSWEGHIEATLKLKEPLGNEEGP